jgi:predicted lipid-binding transport protein (Tim44 family)
MKRIMLVLLAMTVCLAFIVPSSVDAKGFRGGGSYKSPSRTYNPGTAKTPTSNISKPGTTNPATPTANRGFFGGGGFMRGLFIGGLAGMMFGGLFGNLGGLGSMLGFLVNILAIIVIFMIIRRIFIYFIDRRNHNKKRFE